MVSKLLIDLQCQVQGSIRLSGFILLVLAIHYLHAIERTSR